MTSRQKKTDCRFLVVAVALGTRLAFAELSAPRSTTIHDLPKMDPEVLRFRHSEKYILVFHFVAGIIVRGAVEC